MDYFKKNIEALAQIPLSIPDDIESQSVIERQLAKNGSPTIKIADKLDNLIYLHSSYNPEAEANKIFENYKSKENQYLIVLGFGLGYHVEALLKKVSSESKVFIVEKRWDILVEALSTRDLTEIIEDHRIIWSIGKDFSGVANSFNNTFNVVEIQDVKFIEHPPSLKLENEYYTNITKTIADMVSIRVSSVATRVNFKDQWLKNNLENLIDYIKSPGVSKLFNKAEGVPAIVISAGPSLNKNIQQLTQAKGKAILICVGTAIKPVLNAGIKPDIVVTFDGSEANYRHFEGLDISEIPVVYDPMVYPRILQDHHGLKFVVNVGNDITRWLEEFVGPKGFLATGGSVATLAFSLAIGMGCNPVALVGQDLSFPDGKTHAQGTVYENNRVNQEELDKYHLYVPGNDGNKVVTNRGYYAFLVWFEHVIGSLPTSIKVINATEGGAKINGTEVMPLAEYLKKYCIEDRALLIKNILSNEMVNEPNYEIITSELKDTLKVLKAIERKTFTGVDLSEKLHKAEVIYGNSNKKNKILKDLDQVDNFIKEKIVEVPFLHGAMQDILLWATMVSRNNSSEIQDNLEAVQLTKSFYKEFNKSVSKIVSYFDEAVKNLKITI